MRAIEYTETGAPDVLTLTDRPVPEPGPGEVRVRVHRSGVNPTDWKTRTGSAPGTPVDPPQVPNQDGAGVVDAVGEGVEAALIGLRVWIWEAAHLRPSGGTAQEYAVVPARHVVLLPDLASYDLGASLGVPFLTAHRCLTVTEDGPQRLGPGTLQGRTVLVAGGAGAVGNAAIQLARWSDATVLTTVSSPEKANLAARAGADHVIDYRQQDVVAEVRAIAPHGVNTVVEVSPAVNAALDAEVLGAARIGRGLRQQRRQRGHPADPAVHGAERALAVRARLQRARRLAGPGPRRRLGGGADRAARVGEEVGLPLHHYPLDQAAAAHAAVEDGAVGKVIVDVVE